MDRITTNKVRADMLASGMDLVGFAPVERWKNAPFMMSPGAILPESRSVIVAGIHTTDTWIEMGGEPESQDSSPGGWMNHNEILDRAAYKASKLLHSYGYKAIPVVASNIWRYRLSEEVGSLFAPDISHMHAAVAAGLGELGWSGLAITPEYGPRVRFVTIVTDAVLEYTPMYDGPKLCDMCGECIKHCPSYALSKDFNSKEPHVVEIDGKTYRYANKNIWRCAWAEHFGLNLNSKTLEADHIDENIIMDEVNTKGRYDHERGVCQKVCIPPHLRTDKESFGRKNKMISMNRVNRKYPDSMPTLKKMRDDIISAAIDMGADIAACAPFDPDSRAFKFLNDRVPGMKTVIGFAYEVPPEAPEISKYSNPFVSTPYIYGLTQSMHHCMHKTAKILEELGYHSATYSPESCATLLCSSDAFPDPDLSANFPEQYNSSARKEPSKLLALDLAQMAGIGKIGKRFETEEFGSNVIVGAILTDAVLPPLQGTGGTLRRKITPNDMKSALKVIAQENNVDLFGIADAKAFDQTVADIRSSLNIDAYSDYVIDANKKAPIHGEFIPKIVHKDIQIKTPGEYLDGAKAVIVLGMGFPDELMENAGNPKTRSVGPYSFWSFQTVYELRHAAMKLAKALNTYGYRTLAHENLLGIGDYVDSPRQLMPDFRCGAVEAFAAGLGEIGKSGALLTSEYGPNQRFISIVTDAPLAQDGPYSGEKLCTDCGNCISKCPMDAVTGNEFLLHVADRTIEYPQIHYNRCNWAKRYSLHPDEGPGLIGVMTCEIPTHDGEVSIEEIATACANKDPVTKRRTAILEPCLRFCESNRK